MQLFKVIKWLKYIMLNSPLKDNIVLKLCSKWTVLILVLFSFVLTSQLLFGDSFGCLADIDKVSSDYLNLKCYHNATYILPASLLTKGSRNPYYDYSVSNYRKYQSYYSYVNWYLVINAFNFCFPYYVWKWYERKYLNKLTNGLRKFSNEKKENPGLDVSYIAKHAFILKGKHKLYTFMYILLEIIIHLTSLVATFWLVYFFDVIDVPDYLPLTLDTWSDFRDFYFPSTGICKVYPPYAAVIKATCEMPLNRLFMFMFIFLFVWYVLITILTGILLVYRIALLIPSFRKFVTQCFFSPGQQSIFKYFNQKNWCYSDWIFLSRFQKVLTDPEFDEMLKDVTIVYSDKDDVTLFST